MPPPFAFSYMFVEGRGFARIIPSRSYEAFLSCRFMLIYLRSSIPRAV